MTKLIGLAALGDLPADVKVRAKLPCRTCPSSMWEFHEWSERKAGQDVKFKKKVSCYCLQKHDVTWDDGLGAMTRCSIHPVP